MREECTPKAIDAKHKVEGITGAGGVRPRRSRSTPRASPICRRRSTRGPKLAPAQLAECEVGAKVGTDGAAWHSFAGGKPGNDVIAYDRFLHCAVPGVDKMKDGQALVEFLFKQCKDPEYLDRCRTSAARRSRPKARRGCRRRASRPPSAKLAADDRELSAFDDCLRKSRKRKRRDDSDRGRQAPGWTYMEAGRKVREIGKEALGRASSYVSCYGIPVKNT